MRTNWTHLRSPIGHTVKVHPSEAGKHRLYLKHGWVTYTPIITSIEGFQQ